MQRFTTKVVAIADIKFEKTCNLNPHLTRVHDKKCFFGSVFTLDFNLALSAELTLAIESTLNSFLNLDVFYTGT